MIVSYKSQATLDIALGVASKRARRLLPNKLHRKAQRWLAVLDAIRSLENLRSPGLRLEKLSGNRIGQFSIRINDQYRICFAWDAENAESVEIVDYHS